MRITRIEVIPVNVSPSFTRKISRGTIQPGKPEAMIGKPVLVRIHTEGDAVGEGLARVIQPFHGETTQSVVCAVRDFYAPLMIGRSPFDLESFWRDFDRVLPGNVNARAPIDFALYDLMGKILNVPVYQLLGGLYWERIPLEWSVGLGEPEAMIRETKQAMDSYGIKVFCLKAGPSERWKEDVANLKKVREAVGDDVVLGIDANEGYSQKIAIQALRRMEDAELNYAEQPVPGWDLEGMARIREAVSVPITADESVFTLQDAGRIIAQGAADILCVKNFKPGGLCNSKKIAAMAEGFGLGVNVGGTAHGARMEAAVGAHFYASTRNMVPGGEFVMGITEEDPLVDNPFSIEDGSVNVPSGPGLGIQVDPEARAKLAMAVYTVE